MYGYIRYNLCSLFCWDVGTVWGTEINSEVGVIIVLDKKRIKPTIHVKEHNEDNNMVVITGIYESMWLEFRQWTLELDDEGIIYHNKFFIEVGKRVVHVDLISCTEGDMYFNVWAAYENINPDTPGNMMISKTGMENWVLMDMDTGELAEDAEHCNCYDGLTFIKELYEAYAQYKKEANKNVE
jgi:hypothetical protein